MATNVDDPTPRVQGTPHIPLFDAFPALVERVPRIPLARLPTPLERLPLARGEGWVKRDDVTGELYGGNKVRKLEFILPAARAAGAQRLITVGAFGSHHALATTVYGRALGFDVTVVLLPQSMTPHVQEVLDAMHAHGAEIRLVRSPAAVPAGIAAAKLAHRRERLRVVPPGGSDPIGTLGYVNAALELVAQCEVGLAPVPAEVHVAGGTLGTAAGLAVGFAIAGLPTQVVAHRITSRVITNRRQARILTDGVLDILATGAPRGALPTRAEVLRRLRIEHGEIGRGYGFETDAGTAATDWLLSNASVAVDATYTAKAAAGFLAAARLGHEPLLYWHTLSSVNPTRGV